jgi:hypothetical protein
MPGLINQGDCDESAALTQVENAPVDAADDFATFPATSDPWVGGPTPSGALPQSILSTVFRPQCDPQPTDDAVDVTINGAQPRAVSFSPNHALALELEKMVHGVIGSSWLMEFARFNDRMPT